MTIKKNIFNNEIYHLLTNNHYLFEYKNATIKHITNDTGAINVIIPTFERTKHLELCLKSLRNSRNIAGQNKAIALTVIETGENPVNEKISRELANNYIFVPITDHFNKSYIMNYAATLLSGFGSYHFHDVDMIVDDYFFVCIVKMIKEIAAQTNTFVMQPIHDRTIHYLSEKITNSLFNNEISISDIPKHESEITIEKEQIKNLNYPPGGSIIVSANLFHTICGYDHQIFWDWAPEDDFFLHNCLQFTNDQLIIPPKQIGTMYHLYHEPKLGKSSMILNYMNFIRDSYKNMSQDDKIKYILLKHALFGNIENLTPILINKARELGIDFTELNNEI